MEDLWQRCKLTDKQLHVQAFIQEMLKISKVFKNNLKVIKIQYHQWLQTITALALNSVLAAAVSVLYALVLASGLRLLHVA